MQVIEKNSLSETITLRKLKSDDFERFITMRKKLSQETEFMLPDYDECTLNLAQKIDLKNNFIDSDRNLMLLLIVNQQIVGFVAIRTGRFKKIVHSGHLVIGIRKQHWYKGYGKELMQAAIEWAERRGLVRIELTVAVNNKRAFVLYQDHGFQIEGIKRQDMMLKSGLVHSYVMSLILTQSKSTAF